MKIGVDWVSLAILLTAYLFSRIPGVNARLGNGALAAACGIIAGYRYRMGGVVGFNLAMVGLAVAFCLYYLSRAFSGAGSGGSRRPPADSD